MDITELSCDAIDAKPIDVDWRNTPYDDEAGNVWNPIDPDLSTLPSELLASFATEYGVEVPECYQACQGDDASCGTCHGTGKDYEDEDFLTELLDAMHESDPDLLFPVMNYAYPLTELRTDAGALQAKLLDTSLCVVELNGKPYLALQGGGMDFSWDICEAYTLAGLLPPVHFAGSLPRIAGWERKALRGTLNACVRSCEVAAEWASQRLEHVRSFTVED